MHSPNNKDKRIAAYNTQNHWTVIENKSTTKEALELRVDPLGMYSSEKKHNRNTQNNYSKNIKIRQLLIRVKKDKKLVIEDEDGV